MCDDMCIYLDTIPALDRQTDRQTDRNGKTMSALHACACGGVVTTTSRLNAMDV